MFPDLESFFEAARTMKLTKAERLDAWDGIASAMYGEEHLEMADRADVRSVLQMFSHENSLHELLPMAELAPFLPWTGTNLFGHLRPFSI